MIELDVCGLSCPEPVILTMDCMEEHPGATIKVTANEMHTKRNIEKMLTYQKKQFTTTEENGCFEILISN